MEAETTIPPITLPDEASGQLSLPFRLTGSQAKTAFALRRNCEDLISGDAPRHLVFFKVKKLNEKTGQMEDKEYAHWVADKPENLNSIGFLTLTVGDTIWVNGERKFKQVFDAAEASRRFNNVNRRLLSEIFERAIVVTERHKNGAIHFHVLGLLRGRPDIRTGINWAEIEKAYELSRRGGRPPAFLYRSGSDELRAIWAKCRRRLPGLGFGRAELLPIKKTGEAVACYISKYIEKNICNRLPEDKRKKLVRYLGWDGSQLKPNNFAWATDKAIAWRYKTFQSLAMLDIYDHAGASKALGPRWAKHVSDVWRAADENLWRGLWCGFAEKQVIRRELLKFADRETVRKMRVDNLTEKGRNVFRGLIWWGSPDEDTPQLDLLKN